MKLSFVKRASFSIVALGLSIAAASAIPVQLIQTPPNEPANAGDGTIRSWLIGVVNDYNTANATTYPTGDIGPVPDLKVNKNDPSPGPGYPSFGDGTLSIDLDVGSYDYLVLHWGGQQGNSYQAFWIGDEPDGSIATFNAPGRNGLSFYSLYDPSAVPDSGGTVTLLGLGLVGLGVLSRREKSR